MLAPADFAGHRGEWVKPVSTGYRGYEVHQMPPNSQGFSMLMMLNMLEHTDLSSVARTSPEFYHLMAEVVKKAFRDRDRYLTDPDFRDIPLDHLLSKGYGDQLWNEIQSAPPVAQPFLSKTIGQDTAYARLSIAKAMPFHSSKACILTSVRCMYRRIRELSCRTGGRFSP